MLTLACSTEFNFFRCILNRFLNQDKVKREEEVELGLSESKRKMMNREASVEPRVGDEWYELLCPVLLVLDVTEDKVVYTRTYEITYKDSKYGEPSFIWDTTAKKTLDLDDFSSYLMYEHNGVDRGTWCDVRRK